MSDETERLAQERKDASQEVLSHFFIYSETKGLLAPLDTPTPSLLMPLVDAFKRNIRALVSVAHLPFVMTQKAVFQRRFQNLYVAEKIRARGTKKTDEEVSRIARQRMTEEMEQPEVHDVVVDQAIEDLRHLLLDDDFASTVKELHRQATVLVWGAIEVLSRDLFVVLLNTKPQLVSKLTRDERTKRRFLVKESIIEIADEFSFDLSKSMGDILTRYHDVSDLPSIRDVFDVLTDSDAELRALLHDESMWLLFQRRNLILHRRAVVDAAYLARTGEQLKLGAELIVSPDDVEKYMELTTKAGIKLIHHGIELLKAA